MNTSSTENVSFSQPAFSSQCKLIQEAATREIPAMCTQVVFKERVSYLFNGRVPSTNTGTTCLFRVSKSATKCEDEP